MHTEKVSIIIPTYNSEKFIETTLKSVINQSYNNIELIVIDGESRDKTNTIINKYIKYISVYKSEKDKNMYDAINKGMKQITGGIWACLNSDDFYVDSQIIEKTVNLFNKYPDVNIITHNIVKVDENNNIIKLRKLFPISYASLRAFCHSSIMHQPSTFLRTCIIRKHGFFDQNLNYTSDYDYFLRILKNNKMHYSGLYSTAFRMHSGSITCTSGESMDRERKSVLERHTLFPLVKMILRPWLYFKYLMLNKMENNSRNKKKIQKQIRTIINQAVTFPKKI